MATPLLTLHCFGLSLQAGQGVALTMLDPWMNSSSLLPRLSIRQAPPIAAAVSVAALSILLPLLLSLLLFLSLLLPLVPAAALTCMKNPS